MTLPFDGPPRLMDTIRAIANDRLALIPEFRKPHMIGIDKLPADRPVSDKDLHKLIASLKATAPQLYERNEAFINAIEKCPKNWRALRQKKFRKHAEDALPDFGNAAPSLFVDNIVQ